MRLRVLAVFSEAPGECVWGDMPTSFRKAARKCLECVCPWASEIVVGECLLCLPHHREQQNTVAIVLACLQRPPTLSFFRSLVGQCYTRSPLPVLARQWDGAMTKLTYLCYEGRGECKIGTHQSLCLQEERVSTLPWPSSRCF